MENEHEDILLIEAYYEDKLSEEEKKTFDSRRAIDSEFDQMASDYTLIFNSIKQKGIDDFTDDLQRWEKNRKQQSPIQLAPLLKYAAVILLILTPVSFWLLGWFDNEVTRDGLYAQYFSPYEDIISERTNTSDQQLSDAMSAYNLRDYKNASLLFTSYLQLHPQDYLAKIYLANCYMGLGKFGKALVILDETRNKTRGQFHEVAEWYQSLAYLKSYQEQPAISLLTSIAHTEHLYQKRAQDLLEDMKHLKGE